jgi:hypothetical protein
MRKGIKRMIAVVLLIVTVLLIGYSCYTGSRLASPPNDLEDYKRHVYTSKSGSILAFTDDNIWYGTDDGQIILLERKDYKDGVISMEREGMIYEFIAIDEEILYDCQTKELLVRSGDG